MTVPSRAYQLNWSKDDPSEVPYLSTPFWDAVNSEVPK